MLAIQSENAAAWQLRGECWQRLGDLDRALADLHSACRLLPATAAPWLSRGRVLLEAGRSADAVSDLSTAVRLAPLDASAHLELARAFRAVGNIPAALANAERALSSDPALLTARQLRGELLLLDGRANEALLDAETILAASSDNQPARRLRADCLAKLNRTTEALADLSQLIGSSSQPELLHLERARLRFAAEQWSEAVSDFTAFLELHPESVEALANRGGAYLQLNQPALAVADFTAALGLDGAQSELLRRRSAAFLQMDEPAAAVADMQQYCEREPDDLVAAADLIALLRRQKRLDDALAMLNSRRGALHDEASLLARCELLVQTGQLDIAEQELNALPESLQQRSEVIVLRANVAAGRHDDRLVNDMLSKMSDDLLTPELRMLRGQSRVRLGRIEEAVTDFTTVLEHDPQHASARIARAECEYQLTHWAAALADANHVLADDSTLTDASRVKGMSLFRLNRLDDAIVELERPELLERDANTIRWMRCQCLHGLNKSFRARMELDRLLSDDPNHEAARLMRAKLAEERNKLLGDKRAINSAAKSANGNSNLNGQPIVVVILANGRTFVT